MMLTRECVPTACKQTRTKAIPQLHSFRDQSRFVRPLGIGYMEDIISVRPSSVETLAAEIGTPPPQGTFSSQPSSAPIAYSALVR